MRRKIMSFIVYALRAKAMWRMIGRRVRCGQEAGGKEAGRCRMLEELYGRRQPRSCHRESCASVRERSSSELVRVR